MPVFNLRVIFAIIIIISLISFQITVILEIEESNDHNPIFTQAQYSVQLTEHDSILNVNGVMPGTTIGLVSASDQDGLTSLAGQVEYAVVSGNLLGGVAVFNITDPSVSLRQFCLTML